VHLLEFYLLIYENAGWEIRQDGNENLSLARELCYRLTLPDQPGMCKNRKNKLGHVVSQVSSQEIFKYYVSPFIQ
jgi:hypothetical protein